MSNSHGDDNLFFSGDEITADRGTLRERLCFSNKQFSINTETQTTSLYCLYYSLFSGH
jgi:hypothetical protein